MFERLPLTSNRRSGRLPAVPRTRVRRRRIAALLATVSAAWLLGGPLAEAVGLGNGPTSPARTHVIRTGETLWGIAVRYEPSRDPRETVDAIARANDLDAGSLAPGQEILVPSLG
jgi:hypothetical protein